MVETENYDVDLLARLVHEESEKIEYSFKN